MAEQVHVLLSEAGADAERLDALARGLREELLNLEVDDVTALSAGPPPPGARALDVVAVGGLLVSLASSQAVRAVLSTIRRWVGRGDAAPRTVRLEIDGDVLELSAASPADQERLVALFAARHSGG